MAYIEVTGAGEDEEGFEFRVAVQEADSRSLHQVTLTRRDHEELGGEGESPEQLVRRCFDWLLEREPKESILSRFDIQEISRYFPKFRDEIRRRSQGPP
ncbi:MAG: hypothetical protein ACRDGU_07845 [Actinomycetota bacterium]